MNEYLELYLLGMGGAFNGIIVGFGIKALYDYTIDRISKNIKISNSKKKVNKS